MFDEETKDEKGTVNLAKETIDYWRDFKARDSQFRAFDKELEPYRVDSKNNDGKVIKVFSVGSEIKYLERHNIVKVHKWSDDWKRTTGASGVSFGIKDTKKYAEFNTKMDAFNDWKSFKSKVEKSETEHLEKLSEMQNSDITKPF